MISRGEEASGRTPQGVSSSPGAWSPARVAVQERGSQAGGGGAGPEILEFDLATLGFSISGNKHHIFVMIYIYFILG